MPVSPADRSPPGFVARSGLVDRLALATALSVLLWLAIAWAAS